MLRNPLAAQVKAKLEVMRGNLKGGEYAKGMDVH